MNKNFIFLGVAAVLVVTFFISQKDKGGSSVVENSNEETTAHEHEHEHGDEVGHHSHHAVVGGDSETFEATLHSLGLIPVSGEKGAFGYGIITNDGGTDAIVVSATHGGLLDSEMQKDAADPVWHNHLVKLGEVAVCGDNPGVLDITFESPGEVLVKESELSLIDIPANFNGTHSLNQTRLSFAQGTEVKSVVQFKLEPKIATNGDLQAVCVTNIEEIPFDII